MNNILSFKEYLPVITAVLGAFLAYILSGRKYKYERFYTAANESLKDFYCPVFHQLREIRLEKNDKEREMLIEKFLMQHTSENTLIYKQCNQNLIDRLYDVDIEFREFKIRRSEQNWEMFWEKYIEFESIVQEEYLGLQNSIYKNYSWQKKLSMKNFLVKPLLEFTVLIYEFGTFLIIVLGVLTYLFISSKITGRAYLPLSIYDNFKSITYSILAFYIIGLFLASSYIASMLEYKKKLKIIKKTNLSILNRIVILLEKGTKGKFKKNTPPMYVKKDFTD